VRALTLLLITAGLLALGGCAKPRPALYPNEHLNRVGAEEAERDIDECMALADSADLESNRAGQTAGTTAAGAGVGAAVGAAVGAVTGNPARGAAAGAAGGGVRGFFRGIFGSREPSPLYKRYVDLCLQDRGYRSLGWR